MKKIIALVLTGVIAAAMLVSCGGKFTCDVCEKEKSGKKHEQNIFGIKVVMCDDCYNDINKGVEALAEAVPSDF